MVTTPWKKVGDSSPDPIDPRLLQYTVHCSTALSRADFTTEVAAGFVARGDAVAWIEDQIARHDPDPRAPRIWYVVNQATSTIVERIETDEHGAPRRATSGEASAPPAAPRTRARGTSPPRRSASPRRATKPPATRRTGRKR